MGSRASCRLGARASASAQSPAHSFVPPTVPSGLQPTDPFGLTCTGGSLPTFGAFCANALAENSTPAIVKTDLISVPWVMKVGFFFETNGMLEVRFQPGIHAQRRTKVPASTKSDTTA